MLKKYSRRGYSVILEANVKIIEMVDGFLNTFFESEIIEISVDTTWHVMLQENSKWFLQERMQEIVLEQLTEPDIHVYFDGKAKKIGLIEENECNWQVQNLIRMIRVLIRLQCQETETFFLHGGCVSYKGSGICFLGDKCAGKTSSILSFLSYEESQFVSNDDVSVYQSEGVWYAEGWPRSIVVRADTWMKLNGKEFEHIHPLNARVEAPCLYPQQIGKLFGRNYIRECPVEYIVFPQFADCRQACVRELPKNIAQTKMKKQVLSNPGKYNEFLLPFFLSNQKKVLNELDLIFDYVTFLELTQNFNSLGEGTESLVSFIDKVI